MVIGLSFEELESGFQITSPDVVSVLAHFPGGVERGVSILLAPTRGRIDAMVPGC
jgi:hypothetical protein